MAMLCPSLLQSLQIGHSLDRFRHSRWAHANSGKPGISGRVGLGIAGSLISLATGARRMALRAHDEPDGYSRRPLRPSRFGDGPEKRGEGRGEWEGDDGKFNVNWGRSRKGNPLFDSFQSERSEKEVPWSSKSEAVESDSWQRSRSFQRRPPRQMPRRPRRHREERRENAEDSDVVVEYREPWRPPLVRKKSAIRKEKEEEQKGMEMTKAPVQKVQEPDYSKLDPPAKPVNLEALAKQGLPLMNLYQLEPADFYVYLIRELGLERKYAKQIRLWLYQKGAQEPSLGVAEIAFFGAEVCDSK